MLHSTLLPADQRFLDQMHRLGAASIQQLCESVGVTATAVRQRLGRLESLGLVSRETIHQGRGRPHHTYAVTDAGLRQLGDNYGELALLLWDEVTHIEEHDVRQRVLSRLRSALVARYGRVVTGDSVPERLRQLRDELVERGFDVEVDAESDRPRLPILRENNCPYHELASRDSLICDLEQSVFSEVLGAQVQLTGCCRDGHSCCEFQVSEKQGSCA